MSSQNSTTVTGSSGRAFDELHRTAERLAGLESGESPWYTRTMLQESPYVKQVPGENRRRWFADEVMDLTVWLDEREGIAGFELCYDKGRNERSLRWRRGEGFVHMRVDDGEGRSGRHKASPVLEPDGLFDAQTISRQFEDNSRDIDPPIAAFVIRVLREHP